MIVDPARRRSGIGSRLIAELGPWATTRGVTEAWVATGAAEGFYRRCGWSVIDACITGAGQPMTVLHKRLAYQGRMVNDAGV